MQPPQVQPPQVQLKQQVRMQVWELPWGLQLKPQVRMQVWELQRELPQGLPEPAWKAAASCQAASGSRVAADIRVGSPWQADLDNPLVAGGNLAVGNLAVGNLAEDSLVALDSPAAAASCQAAADTRVGSPSSAVPGNPWAAEGNSVEGSLVALGSLADNPAAAASCQAAADSRADIPSVE